MLRYLFNKASIPNLIYNSVGKVVFFAPHQPTLWCSKKGGRKELTGMSPCHMAGRSPRHQATRRVGISVNGTRYSSACSSVQGDRYCRLNYQLLQK